MTEGGSFNVERGDLPEDFMKKLYEVEAKDWKYERSVDGAEHYRTEFKSERSESGTKISNEFGIDVYRIDRFYPHASPLYVMTISYDKEESIKDHDGFSVSNISSGVETIEGDNVKEIFTRIASKRDNRGNV